MPRLFLAVPVRLEAYEAIQEAFTEHLRGRWSDPEQLHMTLAFLGEEYFESDVVSRLDSVDMRFEPSDIDRLGYFPGGRIFHAAAEAAPSLEALSHRIAAALELKNHTFTPHVTLMRVKALRDEETFFQKLETHRGQILGGMEPYSMLFESTLTPEGARYRPLKMWPA